jgi:hypothetical protein
MKVPNPGVIMAAILDAGLLPEVIEATISSVEWCEPPSAAGRLPS